MNMMMFPRMLVSHDEGWSWLMRVHPAVIRMYAFYVVPLSLLPAAMLLYAANTYGGRMMLGNISMDEAWLLAALFFLAELLMVPLMAWAIQRIGRIVEAPPDFHDAFVFAAVVPTPLWLSSVALFVPSLIINGLATVIALCLSGLLIYEGTYRVFRLADESKSLLLAGSILAAGLVAWVSLMGLALVSWGWMVT
jgi:hypothetical protein